MTGLAVAALVVGAAWALAAAAARRARSPAPAAGCAALAAAHAAAAAWPPLVPLVLAGWAAFAVTAVVAARRRGGAAVRRVLQWAAAAAVLAAAASGVLGALHLVLGTPGDLAVWGTATTALVPLGLVGGLLPATAPAAPAALVEAVVVSGLAVLVVGVSLVVVVGLGRVPVGGEREVLVSGIVAAIVVAVLVVPVRTRLVELAEALVGHRSGPPGAMTSFGARMTRAVPLDELLLQLAESLRREHRLARVELWSPAPGVDDALHRTLAVPAGDGPEPPPLDKAELALLARAGVGGPGWLRLWLPRLLEGRGPDVQLRFAPAVHGGRVLALLLVERAGDADALTGADERALGEVARRLAIVLRNRALDEALTDTLADLRRANAELQASRARLVSTADAERRRIERDLHDGAQQHLVAIAVGLRLVRDTAESAGNTADVELLDELDRGVRESISALRDLAHGIYPPLLRERGLGEALRTAAARSPLRCAVEVEATGRFGQDVESCVYFCCLEAIQNAGKHAGAGATILVSVSHTPPGPPGTDGVLRFRVSDDGAGFDPDAVGPGHGFVNMRDRLGAVGGTLEVVAAPGAGAAVVGSVPVPHHEAAAHPAGTS
jgi:signal transduction histidine kinase